MWTTQEGARLVGYQLGIDLGTSYSAAAAHQDGVATIVPLGIRTSTIPSLVLVPSTGSVLVGDAASRRAIVEPERVARDLKRHIGDPAPMIVGGASYGAEALTARLLETIVHQVESRQEATPDRIVITHPGHWGASKVDLLAQAATSAGLDRSMVRFVAEPEAAAVAYVARKQVAPGEAVAVYDLGGGTFDAAVVRRHRSGLEVIGRPEGVDRLGGIDFDAAIFGHVSTRLGRGLQQLDASQPGVLSALVRLQRDCVAAKEFLSTGTEATIPVAVPGCHDEIRLTRADFEQLIRPAIVESVVALQRTVESAGLNPMDLRHVLLLGESSRIPLVGQLVSAGLGRPVAVDPHPKHAVALGAAWLGAEVTGRHDRGGATPIDEIPSDAATAPAIPSQATASPRPGAPPLPGTPPLTGTPPVPSPPAHPGPSVPPATPPLPGPPAHPGTPPMPATPLPATVGSGSAEHLVDQPTTPPGLSLLPPDQYRDDAPTGPDGGRTQVAPSPRPDGEATVERPTVAAPSPGGEPFRPRQPMSPAASSETSTSLPPGPPTPAGPLPPRPGPPDPSPAAAVRPSQPPSMLPGDAAAPLTDRFALGQPPRRGYEPTAQTPAISIRAPGDATLSAGRAESPSVTPTEPRRRPTPDPLTHHLPPNSQVGVDVSPAGDVAETIGPEVTNHADREHRWDPPTVTRPSAASRWLVATAVGLAALAAVAALALLTRGSSDGSSSAGASVVAGAAVTEVGEKDELVRVDEPSSPTTINGDRNGESAIGSPVSARSVPSTTARQVGATTTAKSPGSTSTTTVTSTSSPTTTTMPTTTTTAPSTPTPIQIVAGPTTSTIGAESFSFTYSTNDVCGDGSFTVKEKATGTVVNTWEGNGGCNGPRHDASPGTSAFPGFDLKPETTYAVSITVTGLPTNGTRPAGSGTDIASFEVTTAAL